MFCKNCGNRLDDDAIFCPACGLKIKSISVNIQNETQSQNQTPSSTPVVAREQVSYDRPPVDEQPSGPYIQRYEPVRKKKKPSSGVGVTAIALLCIGVIAVALIKLNNSSSKDTTPSVPKSAVEEGEKNKSTSSDKSSSVKSTTEMPQSKTSKVKTSSSSEMSVGEIGEYGGVYAGLSYVKSMNYVPTAISDEEVTSGHELIVGFFDFYNSNSSSKTIDVNSITCYADGVQVEGADSTFVIKCDGVGEYYSESIDSNTQMLTCKNFEVPLGWSELRFFYESGCTWVVKPEDVKKEAFSFNSLYDIDYDMPITNEGEKIYSGDYDLTFAGMEYFLYSNMFSGDQDYAVFKFRIDNTSNAAIDYSLAGYNMRAYQNNYFLGDSEFILDDKISGFRNIYNVDSIAPGMSANIYVAFEIPHKGGDFYIVYDDGYIIDELRGHAFIRQ